MQDSPKDGINWKLFFVSFLLLIVPTWYTFYYISPSHLPVNDSGQGAGVDQLIIYVHVLMAALFIGWLGYFFYVVFRFSKARNPKADYTGVTSHASTYIEGIVAIFEAVLLIGFAIPVWSRAVDKFPSEKGFHGHQSYRPAISMERLVSWPSRRLLRPERKIHHRRQHFWSR